MRWSLERMNEELRDPQPGGSLIAQQLAYMMLVQALRLHLAERVGMSRSIFALRSKATVGATPMEYLTRWRMLLAGDRLKNSDDSISAITSSLGYKSESAFGKAFRRVMGCSPKQYSRRGSSVATPHSNANEANDGDQPELVAVR
jgi:AraC-like DNA-binding protein